MLTDLTIVIPCYNAERFLYESVRSALECESAPIRIFDDCSTDGSLEIAYKLANLHPNRIQIFTNPKNLGMSANWQHAIETVETDFCLKLDADDTINPFYVFEATSLLRANPSVQIIGGKANLIDYFSPSKSSEPSSEPTSLAAGSLVANNTSKDPAIDTTVFHQQTSILSEIDACRFILRWNPFPSSLSSIYRMAAWRSIGGFETRLQWCTDREIWFRMARLGAIAFYAGIAGTYRAHDSNVTTTMMRKDLYSYDLEKMFISNRKNWPESELRSDWKKQLSLVAKAYFGSSVRALRRCDLPSSFDRLIRGLRLASSTILS